MDWLSDHLAVAWLALAVLLGVLELVSMDLVLIMLAGGALAGMITALLGVPLIGGVLVALATALALLGLIRPKVIKRLHAGPDLKIGAEALIGRQALVLEQLGHHAPGRVKIGGDVWSAQPFDEDDSIGPGELVYVVSIKGATAYVLRVHQLEI